MKKMTEKLQFCYRLSQ